jgi:hypothetical protein
LHGSFMHAIYARHRRSHWVDIAKHMPCRVSVKAQKAKLDGDVMRCRLQVPECQESILCDGARTDRSRSACTVHGFTADMKAHVSADLSAPVPCAGHHFGQAVLAAGSKCVIGDFITHMIRYRSRMDGLTTQRLCT